MSRSGGLEIAFYRQGAEYGKPTISEWSTGPSVWHLRSHSARSADLLALELRSVMERVGGWVLAEAHVNLNQCHFGPVPVIFRFAEDADLLPTGVVPFEVPIMDWNASPPVMKGSEMWHVTIRGCGAQ